MIPKLGIAAIDSCVVMKIAVTALGFALSCGLALGQAGKPIKVGIVSSAAFPEASQAAKAYFDGQTANPARRYQQAGTLGAAGAGGGGPGCFDDGLITTQALIRQRSKV